MSEARPIVDVHELSVAHGGVLELDKLSFKLASGETLVVLGDADSGKDALLRVLGGFAERGDEISGTIRSGDGPAQPPARRVRPAGRTVYLASAAEAPLNPNASIVSQLSRVVARRHGSPRASAREELRIALGRFPGAPSFAALSRKPGELDAMDLSWALLAAAIAQAPDLLVADHAFADLTPRAIKTIVAALLAEQKRLGFALLYAARGLKTAAHLKSRVIVLRQGKVIEEGAFERLASGQSHAYTRSLFKAIPKLTDAPPSRSATRGEPLLQVQALDLRSPRDKGPRLRDGISFELRRGASLALIGEEGSGRRALVRALLGLDPIAGGRVVLDQVDMSILSAPMTSRLRRRIAFVTGADDALDPRMTLWDTVDEPLRAHLRLPRDMVAGHRETALKRVGLASHDGRRAVATLSPFDKRRLQVARAIVSAPFLAVIDEPLRGLDAFAQSILTELLEDFRRQEGPAFLVITADVGVAQVLAEDAMFFKDRKVVERGALRDILRNPKDEETRQLIEAALPATL
ncbi:MAG TPA: ATP-binding cassette domain-containing protein [Rhizomicrobium sp.]|jgi:peptide/nickel transport system ATP-binding protein|nr:ATP-binding cassette domain-containing protein [Rhizomicrobium sp.]